MKLFVGKLSYSTSSESLAGFFSDFGPVSSAQVITDPLDGRSRGFGFVELEEANGVKAITALDGKTLDGRDVVVSEARQRDNSRRPAASLAMRSRPQREYRH